MNRLTLEDTPLAGVKVVTRSRFTDDRGYLERLFDRDSLASLLNDRQIQQVNRTYTAKSGTVRGLHLQLPPKAEWKIVSCLRGAVFDVAVDLRRESATFLEWFGCELSFENARALMIPPGCAHGIQTLEADCEVFYMHTEAYAPDLEAGLNPENPTVGIQWPLPITSISERDLSEQTQPEFFMGVAW